MPLKCYNKPNRSKPRHWNPAALTRIVKEVCKRYGQKQTEAAVAEGWCGETQCEKIVNRVLSAIAGVAVGMAVLGVLESVVEIRVIAFFLRRTAWGKALASAMAVAKSFIPNYATKQADIEILESQLQTFLRSRGRVWLEPPGPGGGMG